MHEHTTAQIQQAHHDRRVRVSGSVRVPLAPAQAFQLFTPLGERAWADGWDPQFPAPVESDSQPGTVFEVEHADRRSVWMVCRCEPDRVIQYARVFPGLSAGTVTVSLAAAPFGAQADVEYNLTALTDAGSVELARFALAYAAYLAGWEQAIAAACAAT
jgi:hypothetical protein